MRPWKHGKLVTGKAIRKLLENGELEGQLEGGFLKTESFDKIDRAAS